MSLRWKTEENCSWREKKRGRERTEREKKRARARKREREKRDRDREYTQQAKDTERTTGAQRPNPRTIMKGSTPPHGCHIREEVDEYRLVMIFLVLKKTNQAYETSGRQKFLHP